MLSGRRPPVEWDDDMELDEVIELDDHELDVKIDDHDLDYLMMPREEGEGFYEDMENRMNGIEDLDVDNEVDKMIEALEIHPAFLGPDDLYDDEDYYEDGEFPDEDDR